MSRIRSVHPGFFKDERLVATSMSARMLFIGLGVEADDKGIFEWKPLTLKMNIFPADNIDVPALLAELVTAEAIHPYELNGRKYGAIRNFRKFQKPKTPNDIHPMPSEIRNYVGLGDRITEVKDSHGDGFPRKGENPPQMEDGGWRMEKEEEAHASSAGACAPEASPEIDLRRKIVAAYGDHIPPDTGYIAVWMAQGYDPVICGAVVEAACQRGKRPKALKWFDEAIREAHDRRAPPPPPPAKPVAPLDLSKTTVSRWNQLIDTWRFSGEWPERMYGPPPDNPGCKVPVEILELDRKRNGAAA